MSERAPKIDISVCICTYKRPEMLRRLLACIESQDSRTPACEVVVVDNDDARSGERSVTAFAKQCGFPVAYLNQPIQNIARARNQAVHAAKGDWLAMIDDDERPASQWLWRMYRAAHDFDSNIVLGPVIAELPHDAAPWIRQGGFFDRPRYASGVSVPYMEVRAGNLFIRRESALELPGPFDPRYGVSGGEDVMMLERLRARGQRIVWCDEASVIEAVPENRLSLGWILRRGYSGAQNYARAHRELGRSPATRILRHLDTTARAGIFMPVALLFTFFWRPFDRGRSAYWLQKASMQLGKLSTVFGLRNRIYAERSNGDPG